MKNDRGKTEEYHYSFSDLNPFCTGELGPERIGVSGV